MGIVEILIAAVAVIVIIAVAILLFEFAPLELIYIWIKAIRKSNKEIKEFEKTNKGKKF